MSKADSNKDIADPSSLRSSVNFADTQSEVTPPWKETLTRFVPYAAIVAVQLIFAANSLIVKGALEDVDLEPLLFSSFRVTIALSCMFLAAYSNNNYQFPHVPRELHPKLAMLGVFGVIGNQVFNIYGLDLTTPTVQAIIQPSMAVWTMGLCIILKREQLTLLKLFGLTAAVVGAIVVILFPAKDDDDDDSGDDAGDDEDDEDESSSGLFVLGVVFLLCNTLSYAIYLVYQKPMLNILHPTFIGFYAFVYGAIGEVLGALYFFFVTDFGQFDVYTWLAILYAGFITSGLGYFLSLWAMKRTNPPLVSLASTIQPVAAAILSYFFRDESITLEQALGGLCIAIGLGATIYAQNRPSQQYQPIDETPPQSLPQIAAANTPDTLSPHSK
eukprot:TRINITY_DN2499_c0_g1_i1.p1 TRINITY_DN2499_c0_g1~~TRINITY_DN2499_c0_g1_i1.p1  ORF type:complete len:386 (-),score=111.74 TRINITY_DN2499_c0_g1_i1:499-1656(-)